MRLLMLSTSFPRRAGDWAGTFVLSLARALAEHDEVHVLTPCFPGGQEQDQFGHVRVTRFNYWHPRTAQRVLYPDGIPTQLKKSRLARLQWPFFVLAFMAATRRLAREVDVVICNWSQTGVLARWALVGTGKPYVVIARGSDMQVIEKAGAAGRLSLSALRRAAAVCTVSEDFRDILQSEGIRRVHFTPNGLDAQRFTAGAEVAKHELSLEGPVVLYAGSFIERKGVRFLVEAMAGLDARLVLVGEGHQQAELDRLAKDKGVSILFAGAQSSGRMPSWYALADVFVLPSFYEGRPNVLMEAMAAGRACIATNIKGTRELIEDGKSGALVPPGDSEAIHAVIKRLLSDDALRAQWGQAAGERVRQLVPSWPESAARYREVFRHALVDVKGPT